MTTIQVDMLLVTWFQYGLNRKQVQAEVVPSSSLVEIEVEVEVRLRLRLRLSLGLRLGLRLGLSLRLGDAV